MTSIFLLQFLILTYIYQSVNSQEETSKNKVWIIDLKDTASKAKEIATYTCQGLYNRNPSKEGYVYTLHPSGYRNDLDQLWLYDAGYIDDETVYKNITIDEFLGRCLDSSVISGYIRYDFMSQLEVVPNIITLGGVLDAIPLEDDCISKHISKSIPLVFDALIEWDGYTEYKATKEVYENYAYLTTSISKMNPGWYVPDENHTPFDPELQSDGSLIELELTDYIVQKRLFNFFLWYGCVDKSPPYTTARKEYNLLNYITSNNDIWEEPIRVFGYDTSWLLFGGYTFEAETNCVPSHNMGAVPTRSSNNLSYFSSIHEEITTPISKNPSEKMTYNPDHIYLSLIIGDGDNIDYVKDSRRNWMEERVSRCNITNAKKDHHLCFPLLWSISPHLTYVAPTILKWYLHQMKLTQRDYFVLPPSGHLYSYPTMMNEANTDKGNKVQSNFVSSTEEDCKLINTNGVVAWEWNGYWNDAIESYFPKYVDNNIVQALYAENVPYMFPILKTFPRGETYLNFPNSSLFLFKPREWRGPNTTEVSNDYYLSSYDLAQEINGYRKGTVTHIYTTSDGGFSIGDVFDMVGYLEDYVHVVDSDQLVDLARQREGYRKNLRVRSKEVESV